ncbi:Serine/threonine protein kinase putative isoform 4 [Tripterygium wilfordii]|uniref:Serine/threonine protein kinase putative isoform 4 n=2 Tax=Tripterygium wilfordii TaxID=458696 RepID=A0A7J7DSV9_TRIWF|nr:Serine/threonine protein kinase putative isoform 4 [Tripterygium wilfordii]
MCNKEIACLSQSGSVTSIHNQQGLQTVYLMDTPSSPPTFGSRSAAGSTLCSNDDTPRVKFLCSFLGSIMPRPQDGKLSYVGGETRIVGVPRDISYQELMNRMRELYEGAAILKYQQPDEDLDALVSVVNDDDVINMMEEYEKLGSGDGFTRLRIFLFSHPDLDGSSHFVDGDDWESERRYVDALNNLNDETEFRRQQQPESLVPSVLDDFCVAEQFFNPMSLEGSLHGQRSSEMPLPHYNLHLTTPHMGSGQHQQSVRYNEMEGLWSPAYYSPRHHHDPRPLSEFPSSPSSARYRMPFGELPDKYMDRMPEEYAWQQVNHHATYDHQPQFSDNVAWRPTGAMSNDKGGFPGNLLHGPSIFEGNSFCEHCRVNFPRNQLYLEQPNIGNGHPQVGTTCVGCPINRETFMLNAEQRLQPGIFPKDQNDPQSIYNDIHGLERGWIKQHHMNSRVEEARTHISGAGRLNDRCIMDGPMNFPVGHSNLADGHHVLSNYVHHRAGPQIGNEVFHDQAVHAAPHLHMHPPEERGIQHGNFPYAYGADTVHPVSHGHLHMQTSWRNVQNPMHGGPSYEVSSATPPVNGSVSPVVFRGTADGSPGFGAGSDNQHLWVDSSKKILGFDGTAGPDYSCGQSLRLCKKSHHLENHSSLPPDPICSTTETLSFPNPRDPVHIEEPSSTSVHDKWVSPTASGYSPRRKSIISFTEKEREANGTEKSENVVVPSICCPTIADSKCGEVSNELRNLTFAEESDDAKLGEKDWSAAPVDSKLSVDRLSFLPELIASVKKAALEEAEVVNARVEENVDSIKHVPVTKEADGNEPETVNAYAEVELDSDGDNPKTCNIEPTKAEGEAIANARGPQTIRNDDLEEIRELGSGTYGAVYHGKWKGSDVAIKRIKASCFAGRPSERERLIADFWKEALILSSLHHPNVVSFYGVVRDGPDGSLATVTEFMINGSLKQFLQKKDR